MTRRAQDEVDLTYITPRTIAMSFPATGYEGDSECRKVSFGFFFLFSFPSHACSLARSLPQSLTATTSTTLLRCCGMPACASLAPELTVCCRRNHGAQHYAVWNLTERGYDYSKLDSNVRETGWPDHHAPPLVLLFSILLSIEDWLEADARNVVVLHCLVRTPRRALPPLVHCCRHVSHPVATNRPARAEPGSSSRASSSMPRSVRR
jgi:hypothetical protein